MEVLRSIPQAPSVQIQTGAIDKVRFYLHTAQH